MYFFPDTYINNMDINKLKLAMGINKGATKKY